MQMSSACTPPVHDALIASDSSHPKYQQYLRYRSAMTAQLVHCPSFQNWLRMEEQAEEAKWMNAHPHINEYRAWLRDNVHSEFKTAVFVPFTEWLKQK